MVIQGQVISAFGSSGAGISSPKLLGFWYQNWIMTSHSSKKSKKKAIRFLGPSLNPDTNPGDLDNAVSKVEVVPALLHLPRALGTAHGRIS